jgi:hypothetical protein
MPHKKAGGGAKASAPSAKSGTPPPSARKPGKKSGDPSKDKKDGKEAKTPHAADKGKGKKGAKEAAETAEASSSSVTATGGSSAQPAAKVVTSSGPGGQKKIEYLSEELMCAPLPAAASAALKRPICASPLAFALLRPMPPPIAADRPRHIATHVSLMRGATHPCAAGIASRSKASQKTS